VKELIGPAMKIQQLVNNLCFIFPLWKTYT